MNEYTETDSSIPLWLEGIEINMWEQYMYFNDNPWEKEEKE